MLRGEDCALALQISFILCCAVKQLLFAFACSLDRTKVQRYRPRRSGERHIPTNGTWEANKFEQRFQPQVSLPFAPQSVMRTLMDAQHSIPDIAK
jgi:hypothetical protein